MTFDVGNGRRERVAAQLTKVPRRDFFEILGRLVVRLFFFARR